MSSNLSPSQLAKRLEGVTATDIAAIIGVHPQRRAIDVWLEKTGNGSGFEGNERTKWGNLLEPLVRNDYAARHGVRVEVHGTHTRPDKPWMHATPDGLVYEGQHAEPDRGLEIKTHTVWLLHHYGAPGTDEVPLYELAQCGWGMAVTGLPRWDLVLFADNQPSEYIIDRDDELIASLIERGERFMVDHVKRGEPPPPDGSAAFDEFLKTRYRSANAEGTLKSVDHLPEVLAAIDRLRTLRDEIAEREGEEGGIVQRLKLEIGDKLAGIEWQVGPKRTDKITWKRPKDSIEVDHEAIANEMRTTAALVASANAPDIREALDKLGRLGSAKFVAELRALVLSMSEALATLAGPKIIERHTKTVPNSRRFNVPKHWKMSTKTTTHKEG